MSTRMLVAAVRRFGQRSFQRSPSMVSQHNHYTACVATVAHVNANTKKVRSTHVASSASLLPGHPKRPLSSIGASHDKKDGEESARDSEDITPTVDPSASTRRKPQQKRAGEGGRMIVARRLENLVSRMHPLAYLALLRISLYTPKFSRRVELHETPELSVAPSGPWYKNLIVLKDPRHHAIDFIANILCPMFAVWGYKDKLYIESSLGLLEHPREGSKGAGITLRWWHVTKFFPINVDRPDRPTSGADEGVERRENVKGEQYSIDDFTNADIEEVHDVADDVAATIEDIQKERVVVVARRVGGQGDNNDENNGSTGSEQIQAALIRWPEDGVLTLEDLRECGIVSADDTDLKNNTKVTIRSWNASHDCEVVLQEEA